MAGALLVQLPEKYSGLQMSEQDVRVRAALSSGGSPGLGTVFTPFCTREERIYLNRAPLPHL